MADIYNKIQFSFEHNNYENKNTQREYNNLLEDILYTYTKFKEQQTEIQEELPDKHNSQKNLTIKEIKYIKELEEDLTRQKETTNLLMNEATNILHKTHSKQTPQNKATANKLKHIISREQKRMLKQYNYTTHQIHITLIRQQQNNQKTTQEHTRTQQTHNTQNKQPQENKQTTQKETTPTGSPTIRQKQQKHKKQEQNAEQNTTTKPQTQTTETHTTLDTQTKEQQNTATTPQIQTTKTHTKEISFGTLKQKETKKHSKRNTNNI